MIASSERFTRPVLLFMKETRTDLNMRKLNLLILLLLALPIEIMADVSRDSLPSNYGNWLNLTDGYTEDKDGNHQKMEVAIDGNTIHLSWVEFTKQADNTYNVWYRRSLDLGKTWEDAKVILKARTNQILNINSGAANRFMVVNNGHIHMAFVQNNTTDDERSYIAYLRSDDGGGTFTSKVIGQRNSRYDSYAGSIIACDGSFIVIGASLYDNNDVSYFVSKDNGQTFTTQIQTLEHNSRTPYFFDLQASNGHWASMTHGQYWWENLQYGYLYMTVSDGETMTSQNIAPLHSNDTPYAHPDVMHGGNGDSYNYHPQMVMDGNTIHVMYKGNPGGKEESSDYNYTLYQKSTDCGQTWSNAMVLPESNGTHGTIAAKGNNVYVLSSTTDGRRVVYYSHDGGTTWGIQDQCTWTEKYAINPTYSYAFAFDPNDQTGNHVYLTGNRFYYNETKDGFKSISRNFVLGGEAQVGHSNNHALTLLQDKDGTQHWFLQYQKPYINESGNAATEKSSQDICYRRVEPKSNPAPSGTKALNLTDYKMIDYRVVIPMTPSLMLNEAMTVEAWVRLDSLSTFQIAGTSQVTTHEASHYNGGWYIKATDWYGDGGYFEAGLRTDKAIDGVGQRIYNKDAVRIYNMEKWHHVAFTYDAKGGDNNARLYIDGILAASVTTSGGILLGSNPIALGTMSGYGCKGLLDHFAIYNRALTVEELREHIYNMPTGQENGCVCLLNFDGTLKDMSGHDNDGVALLDVDFVEHDGIRPPKANFGVAKDITGKNINMMDQTESGEAVWWYIDKGPDYYTRYVTDKTRHPFLKNLDPGSIIVNMLACGDNAYAGITKIATVTGLDRVFPTEAAQDKGVRLRIQGGYELSYSNQPKVVLKQGEKEIEGEWLIEYGYSNKNVASPDELPEARFDLSTAPVGKYDVIVGTETLAQAFTVTAGGEEPDVWMQVNGRGASLWNKWQRYAIDFGNRSNVAAYNTPMIIIIPDRHGTIDVSFDFDFDLCDPALDEEAQEWAQQMGDYVKVYDEQTKDYVRVYSFMVPYIGPNSTEQRSFRIKMAKGDNEPSEEINIGYWIEQPWGPNDFAAAHTRAPFTLEQGECFAKEWASAVFDTAIGFIPGGSCISSIAKSGYSTATGAEGKWSTLFLNAADVFFNCGSEVIPGSSLVKGLYKLGSNAWDLYGKYKSIKDMRKCLNGDPDDITNKGRGSYDPNEMIGPAGYDDNAHYIKPIHNMAYTITYENKSTATAPAHEVYVNDKLDLSKFDPESFGFTSFGWADTTIVVGGSYTKDFTRDIKYHVKDQDIIVRVSGKFDTETGEANWSMISLTTGGNEIDDPDLGYLLPNNADHVGEGFVAFSINHKPNPTNGSTISNKATIVFDANAPIETNVFVNTFDTDYPTSKITKSEVSGSDLVLTFEGSDATSGVASYDLYVFKNGGEAEVLAYGVTESQYTLPYVEGTRYAFCTIATDHVGWKEAKDVKPEFVHADAKISIKISGAKQVTYMSDKDLDFTGYPDLKAYVATGYDKASGTIWLTRVKEVPANTGFLLMGEADTYEIPVKAGGLSAYYQNMFKGTLEATTIYTTDGNYTNYYLSNGESGVGFYKVTKAEGVSLAANRAYLSVPTEIPAVGAAGSTETIKVSSAGQVPYYNTESLDFSSLDAQGVKAYTATGYDYSSGTIWLTRVKQVPAETGILIMAPQGEYPVPTASVASVYANMFKGTLTGTTIQTHETIADEDYINYYLSSGDAGVGFYKVTKEGGVTIGANRCYLPIKNKEASAGTRSAGSGQSQIAFEEADEVIGIPLLRGIGDDNDGTTNLTPALSKGEGDGEWYTLQGQRVAKSGKGLYIRNGKKVVIK